MKRCEKCSALLTARQEKDGLRFCCRACSNSAVPRIKTEESRRKVGASVSSALKRIPRNDAGQIQRVCSVCSMTFYVDPQFRKRKTCGQQCLGAIKKQNAIRGAKTKTERGTHSGWHNRRFTPSYPEQYLISVFEKENIVGWVRELKVGKWFIDFAFKDKKLAVEIDGRQHQDAERKIRDTIKDKHLNDAGWNVIRIPWSNPQTDRGKMLLYPHIHALLNLLK